MLSIPILRFKPKGYTDEEKMAYDIADEISVVPIDNPTKFMVNGLFGEEWVSNKCERIVIAKLFDLLSSIFDQLDCGSSVCLFAKDRSGQRTNGGCVCLGRMQIDKKIEIQKIFKNMKMLEKINSEKINGENENV